MLAGKSFVSSRCSNFVNLPPLFPGSHVGERMWVVRGVKLVLIGDASLHNFPFDYLDTDWIRFGLSDLLILERR